MKAIEVKSAVNVASAWVSENAKGRKEVLALAVEISKKSPKKRWKSLAKAMTENDVARVKAYSLQGDDKKAAFAALRAEAKAAEPKAEPKAKAKAKPKASKAKAKAKPATLDMDALAAQLANVDNAELAAFFNAVVAART